MRTMTCPPLDLRVIDADTIHPILERLVSVHWCGAELASTLIPRVIPKQSGEIVLQFELHYKGGDESLNGPKILYAQHFPQGTAADSGSVPGSEWIDELKLRIWLFPEDPQLGHLQLLCDPGRFHDRYDPDLSNVGYSGMSMGTRATVLGYRLGRRCVARVAWTKRSDGPPPRFPKNDIVIKMSRKRQALALWTRWRQLEHEGFCHNSADGIGMPKSLFLHSDTGALFQDFVHEQSLHEIIGAPDFNNHCERAALALRKLHATRIPGLAEHGVGDELSHLRWLTRTTGESFPMVAADLDMKYSELEHSTPESGPAIYRTAHRDFYDKQVLSGNAGTFLLDCDTLAMADPALDYANFIAHLLWRQYQHPEHAPSISRGIEYFISAYRIDQNSFQHRASWWLNASLLRLACIYSWRPRWHRAGVALAQAKWTEPHILFA